MSSHNPAPIPSSHNYIISNLSPYHVICLIKLESDYVQLQQAPYTKDKTFQKKQVKTQNPHENTIKATS